MEQKFFVCQHCGSILMKVSDGKAPAEGGEGLKELIAGTTDAAREKHVPVYSVDGNKVTVTVGSVAHPMAAEHLIQWVLIKTKQGFQQKELAAGEAPTATFLLSEGDSVEEVYAYCNLHGLWKA